MIDWLKATALINNQKCCDLLNSLDFKCKINELTGEIEEWPKRYSYANFDFVIIPALKKPGYWFEIAGSLHKLWEGKTNWQPFGFNDLVFTIEFLSFICQIDPSQLTISQLEFGINITSLNENSEYLMNNLIGYKHVVFSKMMTRRCKQIGYSASLADYQVKVYDKAAQFHLPNPVLRVEIHVNQHVNRMVGVDTLKCLTKIPTLYALGEDLHNRTKQIVFDDPSLPVEQLRESQVSCLQQGRNPRYYSQFKTDDRKKFRGIIDKYGLDKYTDMLSKAVNDNWLAQMQR